MNSNFVFPFLRSRTFYLSFLRWIIVFFCALVITWYASFFVTFNINKSTSIDGSLFLVVRYMNPQKNDLAAFLIPENDFFASNVTFVKYVRGIPGDVVSRDDRSFFINSEFVGEAKEKSESGVPLVPADAMIIPENHFFMWTPNKDSFDSRYQQIGLIDENNITGRAFLLF